MEITQDQKHALYIVGGIIAAGFIYGIMRSQMLIPTGTITDAQQTASDPVSGYTPTYSNYNMPPIVPVPLPSADANNTAAAAGAGACCTQGNPCHSASPLDTGDTFSGLSNLLDYYKSTNPYYVQLVHEQVAQYSQLFVSGSGYNSTFSGIIPPSQIGDGRSP